MLLLERLVRAAYEKSPKQNLNALRRKLQNFGKSEASQVPLEFNQLLSNLWDKPVYKKLAAERLNSFEHIYLIGNGIETGFLTDTVKGSFQNVTPVQWDWDDERELPELSAKSGVVFCKLPLNDSQWRTVRRIRKRYGAAFIALPELILPFTVTQKLVTTLPYFKKTLEEMVPLYSGEEYFGPLDKLNEKFLLQDKSIIEFGPMDGYQTAGLVHLGARSVTCIEARAENCIKTVLACYAFQWNHVRVIMDDFHNVDASKYGKFDLAFAHGVYYHSVAPFLFFENLLSLSENIFLGGFCATDSSPSGEFQMLKENGESYRVKRYEEGNTYTAGLNRYGYFFYRDDLIRYFEKNGCNVTILSDEEVNETAGRYLRILITKKRPDIST